MKKKILFLALTLALSLGLAVPTWAANTPLTRVELAVLLAPYVESNEKRELPSDCAGLSSAEKDAIAAVLGCNWMYTDENEDFFPNETMDYTSVVGIVSQAVDPDLEFSTSPEMPSEMADDSELEEYRRMYLEWLEQMQLQFPNVPDMIKVYVEILKNKGVTDVQTVDDWNAVMDAATAGRWIKIAFSSAGDITSQPENPSMPSASTFTDVADSDYYADAVQWAVEKNITRGTSKTTFSPNNTCSKAEILSFLWRANGSPEPTAANPFTDIKTDDYFYKAALWAAEKGLVFGSAFGANTDCTRAMTMEYMWKATGSPVSAGKADFNDVPANADYAQAVAWAVEQEITSGTGEGNFSPAATCTRGQIAAFLYRAMGE